MEVGRLIYIWLFPAPEILNHLAALDSFRFHLIVLHQRILSHLNFRLGLIPFFLSDLLPHGILNLHTFMGVVLRFGTAIFLMFEGSGLQSGRLGPVEEQL